MTPIAMRFAGAGLAAWAAVASVPAMATECVAPVRAPEVTVTVDEAPVRYDHSLGSPDMARLSGRSVGHGRGHGLEPAGLTVAEFVFDLATTVTSRALGPGRFCVVPQRIEARLALDTVVYVDRAYPRGTCRFYEVLGHEAVHVDINRDSARQAASDLRRRIERTLAAHPSLVVRDRDAAGEAYGDLLGRAVEPVLEATERARDRRHTEFDAVEGVIDWHTRCPEG